jgi:hypothetical protein
MGAACDDDDGAAALGERRDAWMASTTWSWNARSRLEAEMAAEDAARGVRPGRRRRPSCGLVRATADGRSG